MAKKVTCPASMTDEVFDVFGVSENDRKVVVDIDKDLRRGCLLASVTSPFLVRGVARDGRRKGWRERNGLGAFLLHSVSEVGGS